MSNKILWEGEFRRYPRTGTRVQVVNVTDFHARVRHIDRDDLLTEWKSYQQVLALYPESLGTEDEMREEAVREKATRHALYGPAERLTLKSDIAQQQRDALRAFGIKASVGTSGRVLIAPESIDEIISALNYWSERT